MTQDLPTARGGQNFSTSDLGLFSDLHQFTFEAPAVSLVRRFL
jgi:hypothetical protein